MSFYLIHINTFNFSKQSLWFHPNGSKDGKKAAGRIEFRLERLRLDLSPDKKKNLPRKRKLNVATIGSASMVSRFHFSQIPVKIWD